MRKPHRLALRSPAFGRVGWLVLSGTLAGLPAWAGEGGKADGAGQKEEPKPEAKAEEAKEEEKEKEEKKESEPAELNNWFDLTVGGALTRGDQASFQQRHQQAADLFGGVSDFHYEQVVGKKGRFAADGRGMLADRDYRLRLELSNAAVGYVRLGFSEFRTWQEARGGYLPVTDAWLSLYGDALTLDRGEVWFEAGLTLPKVPQISFGYRHEFQEGLKDSTSWGISTQAVGQRGIVPSVWNVADTQDTITADIKHTLGKTDLAVGVTYQTSDNQDRRQSRQNPGAAGETFTTQLQGVESDLFNVHASSETRIKSKAVFSVGYAYTDLDSGLSGYRVYGTGYDPDLAQRLLNPLSFEQLGGSTSLRQHVANVNLLYTPGKSLAIVPAIRIERQDLNGLSHFSLPAAVPGTSLSPAADEAYSERGLFNVAENLEVRYTGITNWVFYARGEWLQGRGNLDETWQNLTAAATILQRSTDDERFWQKYTGGACWYPLRRLHFGVEYYHKRRENDFAHPLDSTPNTTASLNRYPAFLTAQAFDTDDVNCRVTWRPAATVTLVGRYDFQYLTADNQEEQLRRAQSAVTTSHVASGSLSWTPFARLYLQGVLTGVWDQTDTPAADRLASVQNARNYWTATFGTGYALDERTDLEAQYAYYRADNFADNSVAAVPYGTSESEHIVTAGLTHRFSNRLRGSLKYGYYTYGDVTSGHHTDYDAHLVYSTIQYRF
jgi:hypothetical protein